MVADLLQDLSERLRALGSDWTKYTVVGSFLLYLLGYLALRFHLTAIGIGTDLAVLDERYLFTGARFLVYLVSSVPNIILIGLPAWLVLWGAWRLVPDGIRGKTYDWFRQPLRLTVLGILFSVVIIQFVMRHCFVFSNLLLALKLPTDAAWLVQLMLDDNLMPLYFSFLVATCAVPLVILASVRNVQLPSAWAGFMRALLVFLGAVQLLLLPINYGVLIADKTLPRVFLIGDKPLAQGEEAWLVWEGKEGMTFLVRDQSDRRALLTVPRNEVKQTKIVGFDKIVPKLFSPKKGGNV